MNSSTVREEKIMTENSTWGLSVALLALAALICFVQMG